MNRDLPMFNILSDLSRELQRIIENLLGGRESIQSGGAISLFAAGFMYLGIIAGIIICLFATARAVMRLFKADVTANYLRYYQTSDSLDEPISKMISTSILAHKIQYSNPFHRKGIIILTYAVMVTLCIDFLLVESMYVFNYLTRTFSLRTTLRSGTRITLLLQVILILIAYLCIHFCRKKAGVNKHIRIRRIKGARYDQ